MFRVRVREPNPLQKPWVSPRIRMAQSGQRRQRLKILLPSIGQERSLFFLQPKSEAGGGRIRFLVRQHWDFHLALCATHVRVWAPHFRYHLYLPDCCQSSTCSIMEILASLPLLLYHSRYHPDLLGCCQSKVVDWTPLLLLLFHCWCHPYLRYCYQSQIEDSSFLCALFFFFFLQLAFDIGLSKPSYVYCTTSLSNKR